MRSEAWATDPDRANSSRFARGRPEEVPPVYGLRRSGLSTGRRRACTPPTADRAWPRGRVPAADDRGVNVIVPIVAIVLSGAWPVDDPVVVRDFDPPTAAWSSGHRGIDLRADTGTDVHAMSAGVVSFVGSVAGKPVVTVSLVGAPGLRSTYEPVQPVVHVGQTVGPGTLLGTVAAAGGHCGGARDCVHVGVRTDSGYLDPRTLIGRMPAVLKPADAPG